MSKLVLIIVLCLVLEKCYAQYLPYRRIKRGKYYSNPPQRYYSRPPYPGSRPKVSTPHTNEGLDDEDIKNLVKHLSKHDLDKIIEYAKSKDRENDYDPNGFKPSSGRYNDFIPSQNDFREPPNELYEKFSENDHFKQEPETPEGVFNKYTSEYNKPLHQKQDSKRKPMLSDFEYKSQIYNYNQKPDFNTFMTEPTPMSFYQVTSPRYQEYSSPDLSSVSNASNNYQENNQRYTEPNNYKYSNPLSNRDSITASQDDTNNNNRYSQPLDTQDTMSAEFYSEPYPDESNNDKLMFENTPQYSNSNQYNNQLYSNSNQYNNQNDFLKRERDENLPQPINYRDETDYELSYTNKIPSVAKAESSTYEVANFGDLPLMEYNSKLTSLDSYNVPHYTVTSPSSYIVAPAPPQSSISSSSYGKTPPIEPAPPISAAREQSDAHLKATKIWTNRSKGTAYTLHNDGTLSLERPLKPKPSYSSYVYP